MEKNAAQWGRWDREGVRKMSGHGLAMNSVILVACRVVHAVDISYYDIGASADIPYLISFDKDGESISASSNKRAAVDLPPLNYIRIRLSPRD